jgi:hypothetical protein
MEDYWGAKENGADGADGAGVTAEADIEMVE